jgi:hypothetical protein
LDDREDFAMSVLNDQQDQQSMTQTARDEASGVAGKAKEAASGVVSTSTEQAKEVAGEARRQARDLVGEARQQMRSQAGQQREKAASSLHSLADELGQMAERSDQSGVGTELTRQASQRAHDVASYLDTHEPGDVLDEVRAFARRRPGAFLVGAAVAGMVVGRLTRGAVASHKEDDGGTSSGPSRFADTTAATPSPTYDLPTPPPPLLPEAETPLADRVTASPAGLEPDPTVTGTRPVTDPGSALDPELGESGRDLP